jgi:hypothetical protein
MTSGPLRIVVFLSLLTKNSATSRCPAKEYVSYAIARGG